LTRSASLRARINDWLVGISCETLNRIPRRIGVAGGADKRAAVRGAILGGWVNILTADLGEAERLIEMAPA
jgi:DNA-binding transcriptional regulator LsrR (DeoR family)